MRLYTLDGRFNLCGKRVREARIKAGMSQDTLAAKLQLAGLQIGQMAVSRIELGSAWCQTSNCRSSPVYWASARTGCWEKNRPLCCAAGRSIFDGLTFRLNQL